MQLPPTSRSLLAWFDTEEPARRAAAEMVRLGLSEVRVDRIHRLPGHETRRPVQPLSGRIRSLSTLTLGVEPLRADEAAALAADPAASGLVGGPGTRRAPFCLTAVVPAARMAEVEALVRRFGGQL